jgi:uncharacterized membrane protein
MNLGGLVSTAIGILVPFIEAAGAWIIVWGVLRTFVRHFRSLFSLETPFLSNLRLQLAQSMVMGLEYLLAADVLRTALAPTWTDIGQLAALVAVRTVLNYMLGREVEQLCSPSALAPEDSSEPRPQSRQKDLQI